MGDSCSSPRTASSRVSPRRATVCFAPLPSEGCSFVVLSRIPIVSIYRGTSTLKDSGTPPVPCIVQLFASVRRVPLSSQRNAKNPSGGRKAPPKGKAKAKQSRKSRVLKALLLTGLFFMLLGGAAFAYGYASTDIPDPNKEFQTQTTIVSYANGESELGRFATQNRQSIPLNDMPQSVRDAVIAAENRNFWTDSGIDPKGIVRAAFSNATSESTQGASTITQQYVKVLYLSQERTLTRKVKEAFLTLKIQQQMSKEKVLQGYPNTIYFGRGAYGIQAAAHAYFAKDAKNLSVREGAALASILNSPGNFDPAKGSDAKQRLQGRYQYVLDGMVEMEVLDATVAQEAVAKLPKFPKIEVEDRLGGPKGFLLTLVVRQLRKEGFSDCLLYTSPSPRDGLLSR